MSASQPGGSGRVGIVENWELRQDKKQDANSGAFKGLLFVVVSIGLIVVGGWYAARPMIGPAVENIFEDSPGIVNVPLVQDLLAAEFADRIDTPLLLLTGHGDWNVPDTNTREMYYALRRLGVAVCALLVLVPAAHVAVGAVGALAGLDSRPAAASEAAPATGDTLVRTVHVAEPGDTLWSIADPRRPTLLARRRDADGG